jgi:TrpR-related protein YerC/YecD
MPVDPRIINEQVNDLFKALKILKDEKDFNKFFQDICTVKEIHDLAQRFAVARLLAEGKLYSEIIKKTGASSATISRVKKALYYGADGYKIALEKMK